MMKREFGLDQIRRDSSSLVTVGTFDGVHQGHQALLNYVMDRARSRGGTSVAVSFDPHPREVVQGRPMALLSTVPERADALEAIGLDRFIVIPFTPAFAALSAEDYVKDVLVDRIGLQEMVIGYDHAFGKNREGDSALLKQLGDVYGFAVHIFPAHLVNQDVVSSSMIRKVLQEQGDVQHAAQLLGRPYRISGLVMHGDGRGAGIGYPTANLTLPHPGKVLPSAGVYAVRVGLEGEAVMRAGMMNIGFSPTFGGQELRVEVHIFDFNGNLYDQMLQVDMYYRIRDEQKFHSVSELIEQLSADEQRSRAQLNHNGESE